VSGLRGPRVIIVGVDGSEAARFALEWTARLAAHVGAPVLAVHVVTPGIAPGRRRLHDELRTHWVRPLLAAATPHRCLIVTAESVAVGLLDLADEEGPLALVIGQDDTRGTTSRILGSAAPAEERISRPLVVIVPRAWEAALPQLRLA
jgi:nucleotide-binding universal stress UspA family protein